MKAAVAIWVLVLVVGAWMLLTERMPGLRCKPTAMTFVPTYGLYWMDECGRMHHADLDGHERWVR